MFCARCLWLVWLLTAENEWKNEDETLAVCAGTWPAPRPHPPQASTRLLPPDCPAAGTLSWRAKLTLLIVSYYWQFVNIVGSCIGFMVNEGPKHLCTLSCYVNVCIIFLSLFNIDSQYSSMKLTVGAIRNETLVFVNFSAKDASKLKISVPIIKRRSWGFQNTPNLQILHDFKPSYGNLKEIKMSKNNFDWRFREGKSKHYFYGCAITWLKIMQILQDGGVLESSGPPLGDEHRDF